MKQKYLIDRCPSCSGKGHVLDAACAVLLPIWGWVLGFLETNDADGFTRKRCGQCEGRGIVRVETNASEVSKGADK